MRILITGSRDWLDGVAIEDAIWSAIHEFEPRTREWGVAMEDPAIVVHGCAPGADTLARHIVENTPGLDEDPFPADWDYWRRKTPANQKNPAGMIRNKAMVDAGADVCLAFVNPCRMRTCRNKPEHGSHGATRCADLAEMAGIPVRRFGVPKYASGGIVRPDAADSDSVPYLFDNSYVIPAAVVHKLDEHTDGSR